MANSANKIANSCTYEVEIPKIAVSGTSGINFPTKKEINESSGPCFGQNKDLHYANGFSFTNTPCSLIQNYRVCPTQPNLKNYFDYITRMEGKG